MIKRLASLLLALLIPSVAAAIPPARIAQISQGQPQFILPTLLTGGQYWKGPAQHISVQWLVENANGTSNSGVAPYAFLNAAQFNADVQKFQVKCGDASWVDPAGPCPTTKVRSELDGNGVTNVAFGTTQMVSDAFMWGAGPSIITDGNQWFIVGQFHHISCPTEGAESPPEAYSINPSQALEITYAYNQTSCDPTNYSATYHTTTIIPHLIHGVWYHRVIQHNYDPTTGGTGMIKAWIWQDGTAPPAIGSPTFSYAGPLGFAGETSGPYFKKGIYADGQQVGTMYYANTEITCTVTYACNFDLTTRITNPLPLPPVLAQ